MPPVETHDVVDAFRERIPKDTAILVRISKRAKSMIERAALQEDIETSLFIRKAIEEKVLEVLLK